MGNLLKFEWKKLLKSKSFYICCAVLVALILIAGFTLHLIGSYVLESGALSTDMTGAEMDLAMDVFDMNGISFMMRSLSIGNITIILAIFVSLFTCTDYANGTMKHIISRGYHRTTAAFSKYITALFAGLIMVILSYATAFILGSVLWGMGETISMDLLITFLVQLLGVFAYISIYFMIATMMRKIGGTIAVCIIVPNLVISLLLSLVDELTKEKAFRLSDYWIGNIFGRVSVGTPTFDVLVHSALCLAGYVVVFLGLSLLISRRQEV